MARKKDTRDEPAVTPAESLEGSESAPRRSRRASRGSRESRRARIVRERAQTQEQPIVEEAPEATASAASPGEDASQTSTRHDDAPTTSQAGAAEPTEAELEEQERLDPTTERRRWILLTAFLGVTVLSLIGVSLYLSDVVSQWELRTEELTEVNYDLGAQLADAQDTIEAQTTRIDVLTTQLNTAKDRITALANETANYDDDRAYTAQQIEQLEGLAATGAAVANALTRCIDGEEQLVTYLEDPENYEEEEILAFQESVEELCTAARDSNSEFQQLLNG
ncbi:hypothetical protein [Demequina zhanjiangensis]|uniref:Uncharacterized protein n=1 Tax=Demequina zhanjiangensis TaxID=3051659 RepID=A0ABT8G3J3_9MICO|nr:hypothetical protein [Demequina sp. SYSU T00b26]MDN4473700.1 hypothetical protein [Demequina sp. SYSU T00b26]